MAGVSWLFKEGDLSSPEKDYHSVGKV